jgi:hypothetical protein
MQTSLAVRECVMKLIDVFVYVIVYLRIGMLALVVIGRLAAGGAARPGVARVLQPDPLRYFIPEARQGFRASRPMRAR